MIALVTRYIKELIRASGHKYNWGQLYKSCYDIFIQNSFSVYIGLVISFNKFVSLKYDLNNREEASKGNMHDLLIGKLIFQSLLHTCINVCKLGYHKKLLALILKI